MQFLTLEDETGLVECTFFPDAYARHRGLVRDLGPYVVEGRVEEQHGAPGVCVERAMRLGARASDPIPAG
jgi:DNA polymerase III alpha subunit